MSARKPPRWRRTVLLIAAAVASLWGVWYWPVHTRQGINYEVTQQTLPLSLKLAGFVYRDMEFRHLARTLTRGIRGDEAKVLRLYEWVRSHITTGNPPGLPVVDDHVWNIIVRGYGDPDQLADVLATLCAYAGLPAELVIVRPPGQDPIHALAMVKLHGRWYPIDPYYGVIVRDGQQRLVSREALLEHPELAQQIAPGLMIRGIEYSRLLTWLPDVAASTELRPYRQMPLWRVWYVLRRGFHINIASRNSPL